MNGYFGLGIMVGLVFLMGMVAGGAIEAYLFAIKPEPDIHPTSELLTCDKYTVYKDYLTGEITLYIGDATP